MEAFSWTMPTRISCWPASRSSYRRERSSVWVPWRGRENAERERERENTHTEREREESREVCPGCQCNLGPVFKNLCEHCQARLQVQLSNAPGSYTFFKCCFKEEDGLQVKFFFLSHTQRAALKRRISNERCLLGITPLLCALAHKLLQHF